MAPTQASNVRQGWRLDARASRSVTPTTSVCAKHGKPSSYASPVITCPSCGSENPAGSRFCNACGAELAAAEPQAREYRKVVTVLFCDVVGSTALGESTDPEALRALLGRYFDQMKAIVERHGGAVEKFIGDAVMAVFGVPQVHEDDALRAVRAAVEMRDALPELGVQARIGLNTGEVVVGTSERLATGDAVNVAARLEQSAGAGEVLLGPETARLVRGAVETEALQLEVKGKSEPLTAHRLLTLHEEAPAFARRLDAPLVGRERELRRLQEAFAQAVDDRSCQLFTILGVAGVGKSRLTAELLASLDEATVVRARCLPYGEGITYWPLVEVLQQLPPAAELGLEPAAVTTIERLLGEDDSLSSPDQIHWAVRKLLEANAQSNPLVAVFDDIHWGEPTFLELLEHIADLSRDAPLLLLCLARPELLDERPGWGGGKVNATTLLLEPLSATETDELLERLLGDSALEPDLQQRIQDAAEGNPLFVEEMVALVEDSGDDDIAVPGSIQALLAARLDQLEPAERGVLERGSVEGRVFHRGAVQALAPEETQVEIRLNGLVRKELVRPDKPQLRGEDAYRFRHLLIRDAAYEALPKATRADLHERFAAWLDEHGAEIVELDEIVGYHLEQAYRYREELGVTAPAEEELAQHAARKLATAGSHSRAIGDASGAAKLLQRAASLVPPRGPEGVELLLALGDSLFNAGDLETARERHEQAVVVARDAGDTAGELRASCELALLRVVVDPSFTAVEAIELGQAAVRELEPLGDDAALAAAWHLVSAGYNLHGVWSGVSSALEPTLEYARRAGDLSRERDAIVFLAVSMFWGPTPVSTALPRVQHLLESTESKTWTQSWLTRMVGGFYGLQGRFDEARELMEQARAALADLGRPLDVSTMAFWTGPLELLAGNAEAAEKELGQACDALDAAGERGWLSTMAGMHAEALYALDRLEDTEVAARRCRETATIDDYNAQSFWRGAQAKVLARRGDFAAAEELAIEAVEIIDRSDEINHQAMLRGGFAEVLSLAGRAGEARSHLEQALELYEQKENVVMAERTRAALRDLGPQT
jgi:class 3 adenylate cyclase/tetratricopeptide (TPR) repeat protein